MHIIVIIAIALCHLVYSGFALTLCWSWFISPFGLPAIGLAHAIGIMLVIKFTAGTLDPEPNKSNDSSASFILKPFIQVTAVIIMGLVAHAYM